jgi:hypothetical protein
LVDGGAGEPLEDLICVYYIHLDIMAVWTLSVFFVGGRM